MSNSKVLQALLCLAFVVPGVARSQTIYKCAVKGQPISHQTQPCPANAKILAIRQYQNYVPSRPYVAPVTNQPRRQQQVQAQSAQLHNIPLGAGSQCEAVKRDRDAWERRVGLSRTIESLRAWNDLVQRACN